ncbi:MAG TPA: heavy metal translocating P-type ATPase [Actinomycetota bacterium]
MGAQVHDREVVLDIEGMTCASCVTKIEKALRSVDGVDDATVNLATRTATVRGGEGEVDPLLSAVLHVGYRAKRHEAVRDPQAEARSYARRLAVAVVFTLPVLALTFLAPEVPRGGELVWILTTPVVVYAGWPFFVSAGRAARHGSTTMDTLISLGAGAAYVFSAYSVLSGSQEHYFDTAAVIITLILVGKVLEARARVAAGDASRILMERGAKDATVLVDGKERTIPIDELRPGQVVVVRPGEKVPADGVVKEGQSWIDLSLLTGESVPLDVGPGDEVVGASINGHGRLVVFVTTVGDATKLAGIVRLLEHAQGSKAPVQRLADRISSVFVPIVMVIAVGTFLGWVLLTSVSTADAVLDSIAVLIIACPCALGLATPVAIMAGTGRAAELGVLFKGGEVFEHAKDVDVILLDKTGTITQGRMSLAEVVPFGSGMGSDDILAMAAAVEVGSEHPIARAIVDGAGGLVIPDASGFLAMPGAGARARVADHEVRVGRPVELPSDLAGIADRLSGDGVTVVAVWLDGSPVGMIGVSDRVKADASDAVARMRSMGLEVLMVTGDRRATAEVIAARVGIDEVLAEVLPDGKVQAVERVRSQGHHVVFAGDGLNDAPALAAADVGVAMGTGTDVALAAADVDLLGGTLSSVPDALDLARRTYRIITQNLFWAFAYNVVMIPLAVFGLLNPMWAAAAMALSSVTVVVNALRLRRYGAAPPAPSSV